MELNYLAVLVAAVTSMVVGSLWYGFLFRKQWMALMGYTSESMGEMKGSPNKSYAIQFVVSLVMSYVLADFIFTTSASLETGGLSVGLSTAIWAWLGFVAPITLGSVLWEGRPWKLWFINSSSYLVTLVVMGAILGSWN